MLGLCCWCAARVAGAGAVVSDAARCWRHDRLGAARACKKHEALRILFHTPGTAAAPSSRHRQCQHAPAQHRTMLRSATAAAAGPASAAWPPRGGRASGGLAPVRTSTASLAGRQSLQPAVHAASGRGRLPLAVRAGKHLGGQGKVRGRMAVARAAVTPCKPVLRCDLTSSAAAAIAAGLLAHARNCALLLHPSQQAQDQQLAQIFKQLLEDADRREAPQRVRQLEEQLQRQEQQLAAMLWHQRILAGARGQLYEFSSTMPLDRWLPHSSYAAVAGQVEWNKIPGLCLQLYSRPLCYDDDDNPFVGFEVRLVPQKTPCIDALDDLGLSIPITVDSSTWVALLRDDDPDSDECTTEATMNVSSDIEGTLTGSEGATVWIDIDAMRSLGLVEPEYSSSSCEDDMEAKVDEADYFVHFKVVLRIGA